MERVDEIQQFFILFREIDTSRNSISVPKLEKFLQEFLSLKSKAEILARAEAPQFNIFYLLGVERDEIRTHSKIIAAFLDPSGSHGQKALFLHSFLNFCYRKFPDRFPMPDLDTESNAWRAYREHNTGDGRVDIVIQNPELGFVCLIENKIDASEQSGQLTRYRKWLESESIKREYPYRALLFLTPDGRISTTLSDKLYGGLSYRKDIYTWLGQVIPDIKAENVRQVVLQYRNTISRL